MIARAILTSGVAAKIPSQEIATAGDRIAAVADAIASSSSQANAASFAGAHAANSICDTHFSEAIEAIDEAASHFSEGVFLDSAVFSDAYISLADLFHRPLWREQAEPDGLFNTLADKENVLDSGPEWAFWRDWYQGFLDGKPLDWELQRRVALIDDEIWKAGPEAVAEKIEQIRAEYLAEKYPQAERIEFNPETAKFFVIPIAITKPGLLAATLTQVEDALDDALASPSNGLHDRSREVRVLRRITTKYGNDPQQIEMGFVSVHSGLTRQILSDELPPSEENLALQAAVEEGARAIRATHPEVAENRKILSEQVIRELPEEANEKLEKALPVLRAISEADLAEDWNYDIPALINDATGTLPSGAPALPGADEATRIFSRAAKISILIRTTEAIKTHPLYSAGNVLLTLRDLVLLGANILARLI